MLRDCKRLEVLVVPISHLSLLWDLKSLLVFFLAGLVILFVFDLHDLFVLLALSLGLACH